MHSLELDFSGSQSYSLYREPDSDFIDGFYFGDVESITPIVQTPWCGSGDSIDERVLNPREWTPRIPEHELGQRMRRGFNRGYSQGVLPGSSRFRIVHVATGDFEAYVFNFIEVDDAESREWFDRVVSSYQCAMRLGAHVPTAVFGDRWIAIQAPENVHGGSGYKEMRNAVSEDCIPVELLILDLVRFLIIGHGEGSAQSLIRTGEKTYSFGSLEFSGHRVRSQVFRFVMNARSTFGNLRVKSRHYRYMEDISAELADCLRESTILDPYMGGQGHIEDNLVDIPDIFKISMDDPSSDRETILDITDCPGSIESVIIPDSDVDPMINAADRRAEEV